MTSNLPTSCRSKSIREYQKNSSPFHCTKAYDIEAGDTQKIPFSKQVTGWKKNIISKHLVRLQLFEFFPWGICSLFTRRQIFIIHYYGQVQNRGTIFKISKWHTGLFRLIRYGSVTQKHSKEIHFCHTNTTPSWSLAQRKHNPREELSRENKILQRRGVLTRANNSWEPSYKTTTSQSHVNSTQHVENLSLVWTFGGAYIDLGFLT